MGDTPNAMAHRRANTWLRGGGQRDMGVLSNTATGSETFKLSSAEEIGDMDFQSPVAVVILWVIAGGCAADCHVTT